MLSHNRNALLSSSFKLILETLPLKRYQSTLADSLPLPPTSAVGRGIAFEQRSLKLLGQSMSMSLRLVGGKDDGGIDLLGWWWLPHDDLPTSLEERRRIRVVGQCKAEKKKMGPNYVRELEGVVFRFLATSTNLETAPQTMTPPVVAVLISQSPFTKSTLLRAQSSPIPFFLLHLPPVEDMSTAGDTTNKSPVDSMQATGDVGYALCNPALSGLQGLLRGQLEVRWERHSLGHSGRPALWWKSKRLPSHIPSVKELE